MLVSFDVSDLATGRADGTTRYTRELARHFPIHGADVRWRYLTPAPIGASYPANVTVAVTPWRRWWTQLRLPGELTVHRPDVLFMPIQQLPYIRPRRMKTVAVVHDLAVHYFPRQYTYKDWILLHTFSAQVAREADHIIAVSHSTAADLARFYGRRADVTVIHHGVDHSRFHVPDGEAKVNSWQALRNRWPSISGPYLLFVGQIQPRKNVGRLIAAFERLAAKEQALKLVVVGGHGWKQGAIRARSFRSAYRERIVWLGAVPDERLPALYWHAEVLVLPSFYEGFGLPILEAFACGCPVVTSNVSSLPEVAGQAAVLVDPRSVEAIAAGIVRARQNREMLIAAGRIRAAQFSWERCAAQTLAVLRNR